MTDCVLDASALALALTGRDTTAGQLRGRLRESDCHAPHLIDAEVGNVLRRQVRTGSVTAAQGHEALRAAARVIDVRYPHTGALAELAWTWRHDLSFSDALYVALAVRLDLPLLTVDGRLGRAPRLPCVVEVV